MKDIMNEIKVERDAYKKSYLSFSEAIITAGGTVDNDAKIIQIFYELASSGVSIYARYDGPAMSENEPLKPTDHLIRLLESQEEILLAAKEAEKEQVILKIISSREFKEELAVFEQNSVFFKRSE